MEETNTRNIENRPSTGQVLVYDRSLTAEITHKRPIFNVQFRATLGSPPERGENRTTAVVCLRTSFPIISSTSPCLLTRVAFIGGTRYHLCFLFAYRLKIPSKGCRGQL